MIIFKFARKMGFLGETHLLALMVLLVKAVAVQHCPKLCFCSKDLTSVNCEGKRLIDLPSDIPAQVVKLYLKGNKLSSIAPYAFARFDRLQYLDLRQNILNSIDEHSFANCSQLQMLYLTANSIDKIHPLAFEGSPHVVYLSLEGNMLRSVPGLPHLVNLQSLILEGNKIKDATFPDSFSSFTALTDVVMSNNMIGSMNNKTFNSLSNVSVKKVEISRSGISRVDSGTFSPLRKLMSLKIGYNPLDSTQLSNVIKGLADTSVVSLDIRNISLAGKVPLEAFSLLRKTQIKVLKMKNNKLNTIPSGAFENLPKLILVDLSACAIQTIQKQAFKDLSVLQTLFLYDNGLARVPQSLPTSLRILNLNNNQIDKLINNDFSNLTNLQELYLSENSIHELQELAFYGLTKLRKLHLSYNQISTLPGKLFYPFTRLLSLELNNNNLIKIPSTEGLFSSMSSLVYLNLRATALSSLPSEILGELQSLQYLHLEDNQLGHAIATDLSGMLFKKLAKLKELYISNNNIYSLPEPLLAEQKFLTVLNISKNRISHWDKNFFVSTQNLITVDLSMNLISLINQTSVNNLRSLKFLNLTSNPFACNCNAKWFCAWMNKTTIHLPFKSHFTCNLPPAWQGKSVMDFCAADIDCTDYTLYYILGAAGGTFILSIILLAVLYRYRWYVRHRFYKIGRTCTGRPRTRGEYSALPGEDKSFDIYISYDDEDRVWVSEKMLPELDGGKYVDIQGEGRYSVCFRERDFPCGRSIISSMDQYIPASRYVIIIATKSYVTSKQCEFEFDLVRKLHVEKEIENYFVVKVGKLPVDIPKALDRMIARHEYQEWVDPATAGRTFFERLTDQIGPRSIADTAKA